MMSDRLADFQQAKSAPPERADFTNCGKDGHQETPVKPAQKKLTRVPFTVSRLMEFCTRRELVNQTGHDAHEWPLVILKELVDNALDAAEEAEIAPVVAVTVKRGSIMIEDNGPGIPAKTIKGVLDYGIRVSSREAYCSPTRGAQGNALKTILPMPYVMDERHGEDACGETIIEAHGLAHHIGFGVDHIRQEPKISHTMKPSPVVCGTRITIDLPKTLMWECDCYEGDTIAFCKSRFLALAESYAWLNPPLIRTAFRESSSSRFLSTATALPRFSDLAAKSSPASTGRLESTTRSGSSAAAAPAWTRCCRSFTPISRSRLSRASTWHARG
jgi:hypothetical protein